MAPNQPKLTADWFTLRMRTTHTPPRRNGPCRKDQHAMGGKDSYQSISAWQQTTPTSPWYNPIHQFRWGGGTGAPTRVNQPITHSQRALSPRATSVVNPDTSSATAPTRTLRQTTAAVPGCKEGPGKHEPFKSTPAEDTAISINTQRSIAADGGEAETRAEKVRTLRELRVGQNTVRYTSHGPAPRNTRRYAHDDADTHSR